MRDATLYQRLTDAQKARETAENALLNAQSIYIEARLAQERVQKEWFDAMMAERSQSNTGVDHGR